MESAIDIGAPRNGNARAYLAGGGATTALVAAAVVLFVGVAAFVGFSGLPFGADDSADGTVDLAAGVPQAAATAAAPTAGAVAAEPATPGAAAVAEILAALPPGTTIDIPGVTVVSPGTDGFGGTGPGGGRVPLPGPVPTQPGLLGNTVGGLETTAGSLGLNVPLTDLTQSLTGPLDETVTGTVNGVGGVLGDKQLGDKVVGSLNQTTNSVLGQGGLADSLLNP